jgi:hypothetical protein
VGLSPRLPERWGRPLNGVDKPRRNGGSNASDPA